MRNRNNLKSVLRALGCIVLIAAMALTCMACGAKKDEVTPASENKASGKEFTVKVTDLDGNESTFTYASDKASVGEALLAEGLIEGEDSEYGLYVTTVNGITLDWDKDQKYWAFYVDGEYALTGVDNTEITAGATYSFVPEG